MNNKRFILLSLLGSILFLFLFSKLINFSVINNPLYKKSQKRVLESYDSSQIVFVGDSSLEYGLDAQYFSKLCEGISVSNLALSAKGHDFAGTYNMLRHTIENNHDMKMIVIMHTPYIWYSEFSMGGYCSTLNDLDSAQPYDFGLINEFDCFKYHHANFKAIYESYRQTNAVNEKSKFPNTYKNGKKNIYKEMDENIYTKFNSIGSTKMQEIKMIDEYLKDKKIKVIYVQGTFHSQLAKEYAFIIKKQQKVLKNLNNIIFVEKYLYPKNENMGNTENHVDASYKKESTKFYFDILKPYIENI